MHHVRQGNQWYFGIKAHIGADAVAGLAKSLAVTGANVAGVRQVPRLLDGGVGRCGGGGVAKAGDTEPVRTIVRRLRRKLGADADYPTTSSTSPESATAWRSARRRERNRR